MSRGTTRSLAPRYVIVWSHRLPHRRWCLPQLRCRYGITLRAALSAYFERRGGDRNCSSGSRYDCRGEQRATYAAAEHGCRGFCLFSRKETWGLYLDWHRHSQTGPCCTTPTTISTTRSCRWAPAIGCGSPKRRWQRNVYQRVRDEPPLTRLCARMELNRRNSSCSLSRPRRHRAGAVASVIRE